MTDALAKESSVGMKSLSYNNCFAVERRSLVEETEKKFEIMDLRNYSYSVFVGPADSKEQIEVKNYCIDEKKGAFDFRMTY